MSHRILTVARWYPAADHPGRGSFVADHVAALVAAGHEVIVASFEPVAVRGGEATRPERGGAAAAAFAAGIEAGVAGGWASPIPLAWGAGVPVARLPVVLDGARRQPSEVVEAHARPLLAFGLALAAQWQIDVVHAHTGLPDGIAASRLAEGLGVPLLTTEHSSTIGDELADPEARALYAAVLRPGHRLVAVSRSLADEVAGRLGVTGSTIGVLPNAVPVERFPIGPAAERDPAELLYVGARKASKGIETLLRAFAATRLERPGLRLRLVGTPGTADEEARWNSLSEELGVAGAVSFEGRAEREAVSAAMRRAALFVHPSPRETFGMVAAEALASGLPVAATPSGGVEEVVGEDGRFGEIAATSDDDALAGAIGRALELAGHVDEAEMHAYAEGAFSARAIAQRTGVLYDELLREVHGREERRPPRKAATLPASAPFRPPLVVGLLADLAAIRLEALPDELTIRLLVVTAAGSGLRRAAWRWLELDPERSYRERLAELGGGRPRRSGLARFAATARAPLTTLRRRDLVAHRAEFREEATQAFLRSAWQEAGEPRQVLALDADDVLLVGPLLAATGASLAPGGLRWLMDRWDEAGRPGPDEG